MDDNSKQTLFRDAFIAIILILVAVVALSIAGGLLAYFGTKIKR